MATRGGYDYRQIDCMIMAEVQELMAYWSHTPPLRDLVSMIAQGLGAYKPTGSPASSPAPELPPEFEEE